jgi:hypothetical protein
VTTNTLVYSLDNLSEPVAFSQVFTDSGAPALMKAAFTQVFEAPPDSTERMEYEEEGMVTEHAFSEKSWDIYHKEGKYKVFGGFSFSDRWMLTRFTTYDIAVAIPHSISSIPGAQVSWQTVTSFEADARDFIDLPAKKLLFIILDNKLKIYKKSNNSYSLQKSYDLQEGESVVMVQETPSAEAKNIFR